MTVRSRVKLGEIADLQWGDTSVTKKSYVNSGNAYPAFSASGQDGYLPYFDYDRAGVVLSAIGANAGKTWLATGKWSCIKNTIRFFSFDETVADTRYLYWATQAQATFPLRGSAQPFISQGDARDVELLLPPIEEQRAIAAILSALDDKIDSNQRIAKRSQDLLNSISNQVGESLASRPLGELARLSKATVNPATLGDSPVDHFSLPAFDRGGLAERVGASKIMSSKLILTSMTVLVSRLNPSTSRTWWAVPQRDATALASTEFAALLPVPGVTLAGLWLAVADERFRGEIAKRVTGTSGSHQRIRTNDLLSVEVSDVSQLDEPTVALATSLLEVIDTRRRETQVLVDMRDSLLPELISGRIRIPVEAAA